VSQALNFGASSETTPTVSSSNPGFGTREQIPLVPKPKESEQKVSLTSEMQDNLVTNESKNQQFYDDLEINMDDLEHVEERIAELENYIGIDPNTSIDFFVKNDIEKIDIKCNQMEDFVSVIEDKNFMMLDLFSKYD
jgi:hypothetical protein